MIEALATLARALTVLATAHLLGSSLFLLRAGLTPPASLRGWQRGLIRSAPLAALLLILGLSLALAVHGAQLSGSLAGAVSPDLLRKLATQTAYGQVWTLRISLAVLLLLLSLFHARRPTVPGCVGVLLLSAAVAVVAPWSSHAAGSENAWRLVPVHALHLLALGAWMGALPAWGLLTRAAAKHEDAATLAYTRAVVQGFSALALICVALMLGSGLMLSWAFIADQGDLLGTRYGLQLCAKLLLLTGLLVLANSLRRHWLPRLHGLAPGPSQAGLLRHGARQVGCEYALGLLVLFLGAALAQTTPAIHDQATWYLPFRLSLDASWIEMPARYAIIAGGVLSLLCVGTALRSAGAMRRLGLLATSISLAVAIWGLSVPAHQDSFRRSPVPYLTLSIDQGLRSFSQHCVSCHGSGGLGDGPLAASLPKPPANLSEPHTSLHTPGDMYGWISRGMPRGAMPGFAAVLDEEQRWDLVNFLHAFSQGFQARVLGSQIAPRQPWLGAPNFYFEEGTGARAELKDFRERGSVLLVFEDAADPRSTQRVAALRRSIGANASLTLVVPDGADVWQAYQLLSRSLEDRGRGDQLGMPRRHAEFLIDRYGYVRARWIPADEKQGWASTFDAAGQAEQLASEREIIPPPDLHLH